MNSRPLRTGKRFINVCDVLKKNIEPSIGRKISHSELTNSIASFLENDNALERMIRIGQRKRRGGLFD